MIQQEIVEINEINENKFVKTTIKSEFAETHQLKKIGTTEVYDEAIDILGSGFQYEAVEKPVEVVDE